jgi:RNA ligase (TIGR02306 family)
LEQHPNADTLSIVHVFGYTVCVRTADWVNRTVGAYVVPDSIIPVDRTQFKSFEDPRYPGEGVRIRAKRLRGVISYGMLTEAPEGANIGDDVADQLGITHYDPPPAKIQGCTSGRIAQVEAPDLPHKPPYYDIDAFQRYAGDVFVPGEMVFVTEKVHGANARYVCWNEQMYAGGRTQWVADIGRSPWWVALRAHPELEAFCRANPGTVVYGEVFGAVQTLHYGRGGGEANFVAFDLLLDGTWVPARLSRNLLEFAGIPLVPLIAEMPYDFEALLALADGPSLVPGASHYREGVVIKPAEERWNRSTGRTQLKLVSATYYENSGKEKPWKG